MRRANPPMKPHHRIFLSTENNPYCAWQAKLFYFSCVTRLNHLPVIIVHAYGREWHPYFRELAGAGAIVRPAKNYSKSKEGRYPPRNTAGTLLEAAKLCAPNEFIVLCDPDMIFVRPPKFPSRLAGNHYSYMDYNSAEVLGASKRLKVDRDKLQKQQRELCCGVPYVIPAGLAAPLAKIWLTAIDAFAPQSWIDVMHAFGLAAVKLDLRVKLIDVVDDNHRPHAKLQREMIHYAYGDKKWDKRQFFFDDEVREVWRPKVSGKNGTVMGEILAQISGANDFYSNSFLADLTGRSKGGG